MRETRLASLPISFDVILAYEPAISTTQQRTQVGESPSKVSAGSWTEQN